ncbi:protein-arginine kinase [Ruminococcaceae bacterium R-25]|nr:protein-arginine kinase [Ruminococcaceae bacterium R-25]SUQ22365.1 Protein-arginine kinase [Oscillospiraceae bacterium]
MSEWYTNEGKDSDVVLSTKACIVRNIKGYNFMPRLDDKECQSLLDTVDKEIDKNVYSGGNAADFDKNTVLKLTRLQILGREANQMANPDRKAFYYNDDVSVSIAVGSGEHLTVKAMAAGHDISVYKQAEKVALDLESKFDIAFSDTYGFLTSSVSLAGTGLKILYTVSLPAISKTEGGIAALKQRVGQYEWMIYPFAERGEISDSDVYIIASVNTLGVTEDELLKRGEMLISDVIKAERALRDEIAGNKKDQSQDVYGRSYGTLRYANMISRSEALQALGWLRLYHEYDDTGDIKISWNTINKLTMDILWEPEAPSVKSSQSIASQRFRAQGIRKILKGAD